jgi:hypothetical protein
VGGPQVEVNNTRLSAPRLPSSVTHKLTSVLLKRGYTLVRLGALASAIGGGLRWSSSLMRTATLRNSEGNCEGVV